MRWGRPAVLALAVLAIAGSVEPGRSTQAPEVTLGEASPVQASARAQAPWCGTLAERDRTPNAVAGHPVKWVYALPADGQDRSGALAEQMQGDAEEIDTWWRREDPERTLRNDLASFPCGLQLDLALVRLPQSGAQLAGGGRFTAIFNGLLGAGFRSSLTKYVVYYDGPVSDARICGQGGSDRTGMGLAVVYVQACSGVSTAAVAAHEVLHTFGAVPSGAPNLCPPPDGGHTCDDPRDLMHPRVGLARLHEKLLDPGRDDYYGHGGTWPDARNVPWLVQLDRQAELALAITGPGGVTADVPGLDCGQTCTTVWNDGTRLNLTATERGSGAKFIRWSGACAGASRSCTVTVGQVGAVRALFAPATYRLTVRLSGQGTVRSGRPGISCRPRCAAPFASFVPVRLTATPAPGWRLRSWAGACRGGARTCTVPMARAVTARAIFVRD